MLLLETPPQPIIAGENAVPVSRLPQVWQDIASGKAQVGLADPTSYVEMAQLFQYKLEQGDVDLFNERPELARFQASFAELFGLLAQETLEFYGQDFQMDAYPDFDRILQEVEQRGGDRTSEIKVVRIVKAFFEEFGYELPASVYQVNLAPIDRDTIFEERALRFDPRDQAHKRPWDAALHAGKVYAVQMKLQSLASQYGFTYHHGCGCENHLSSIDAAQGAFDYDLDPQKRQRWIRSFVWTAWYEYAFFPIVPNTMYLTR
ncbi:MAG: hypothetical protein VKK04_00740 [Synechococcales bacterium]|nr:hypothetical protein [Synechococcales bacterium]